jgi:hypothetical protein
MEDFELEMKVCRKEVCSNTSIQRRLYDKSFNRLRPPTHRTSLSNYDCLWTFELGLIIRQANTRDDQTWGVRPNQSVDAEGGDRSEILRLRTCTKSPRAVARIVCAQYLRRASRSRHSFAINPMCLSKNTLENIQSRDRPIGDLEGILLRDRL